MSVSEQEAKQQIAQMRQALVSMKASARRASYVRIVGLILGFGIVGIYVYLFISLGMAVSQSKKFRPLVEERIKTLDLQQKAIKVVEKAVPIYWEEGQKMLTSMDWTPVEEEGRALLEDLRPLMLAQVDRVWPQLQSALVVEGNDAAKQLETNLQTVLDQRVQAMVAKHSAQIQSETGLTEQQTALVVGNIVDAGKEAMLSVVDKRWKQNETKLEAIADLVDRLPALPQMSEEQLLGHLRDTLIALVKIKLPDYDLEQATGQPLVSKGPKPTVRTPARKPVVAPGAAAAKNAPSAAEIKRSQVQLLEEQLKRTDLTPEQRQNIQKQLDQAKAALNNG